MIGAYYNEIDPYAAAWLRNLIAAGHIAPGEVDERSIEDVKPTDLAGYVQCHFFAGIGVWSYALRLAGWPDDLPVWTGSCPCQPFSAAGKQEGFDDKRHLWPTWSRLIGECNPRVVFGEQVAAKAVLPWLDLVHADLEAAGYALGAVDLCAAGVGAPHIRQRLFFVADANARFEGLEPGSGGRIRARRTEHDAQSGLGRGSENGELADALPAGRPERRTGAGDGQVAGGSGLGDVGDTDDARPQGRRLHGATESGNGDGGRAAGAAGSAGGRALDDTKGSRRRVQHAANQRTTDAPSDASANADRSPVAAGGRPVAGFWHPADWLPCIDGKARPVEPGTFPLAHGAPARVGRLRAYGNAIVAPLAAEFVAAYLECRP